MKLGLIAIGKFMPLVELQVRELVENNKEAFEIRISPFARKV